MLGINAAGPAPRPTGSPSPHPATLLTHEGGSHRLSVNKGNPQRHGEPRLQPRPFRHAPRSASPAMTICPSRSARTGAAFAEALRVTAGNGRVRFPKKPDPGAPPVRTSSVTAAGFAGTPEPAGGHRRRLRDAGHGWRLANSSSLISHGKFRARFGAATGAPTPPSTRISSNWCLLLVEASRRRYYPRIPCRATERRQRHRRLDELPPTPSPAYTQLHTRGYCRPVQITTSNLSQGAGRRSGPAQSRFQPGFRRWGGVFAPPVIADDGVWHHVCVMEGAAFGQHWRYDYDSIRLYQRPGDVALIAFPAMVPGEVRLPVGCRPDPWDRALVKGAREHGLLPRRQRVFQLSSHCFIPGNPKCWPSGFIERLSRAPLLFYAKCKSAFADHDGKGRPPRAGQKQLWPTTRTNQGSPQASPTGSRIARYDHTHSKVSRRWLSLAVRACLGPP